MESVSKLLSPTTQSNRMTPKMTMSPRSLTSLAINGISKHNRTSILRLEKVGYTVHSPGKEMYASPLETRDLKGLDAESRTDLQNQDIGIGEHCSLEKKNAVAVSQEIAVDLTEPHVLSISQSPRPPPERTPLEAFVTSLAGVTSPLTRSKRKELEMRGDLLVYKDNSVEIFAVKP